MSKYTKLALPVLICEWVNYFLSHFFYKPLLSDWNKSRLSKSLPRDLIILVLNNNISFILKEVLAVKTGRLWQYAEHDMCELVILLCSWNIGSVVGDNETRGKSSEGKAYVYLFWNLWWYIDCYNIHTGLWDVEHCLFLKVLVHAWQMLSSVIPVMSRLLHSKVFVLFSLHQLVCADNWTNSFWHVLNHKANFVKIATKGWPGVSLCWMESDF